LAVARAIENSCYFVLASSIGENIFARIKYMGNSMIARSPIALDPFSMEYVEEKEIIAKANGNETMIHGKVDLKRLRREQEENPHYKDMVLTSCFERRNSIEKS
jgi:predicted amidohydrolase